MIELNETLILQLHAASTLFMTGLIWFVQTVHYPLFAEVPESGFAKYSTLHQQRTTLVVGPAMLLEAATAMLLLRVFPGQVSSALPWWGMGLLLLIWLVTALVSVPAHGVLEKGFDRRAHRRLVVTNWIRTIAWSCRGLISLAMLPA